MKQLKAYTAILAVVVAFVALGLVPSVMAQGPQEATGDDYTVVSGDTLWVLSQTYREDPAKWRELVAENPWLTERVRERLDGTTFVLIRPGEHLKGLVRLGLANPLPELAKAYAPIPASVRVKSETSIMENSFPWLLAAILAFLSMLVLMAFATGFGIFRNAATGGVPVVPGGIGPTESGGLAQRAQEIADRRYASANPTGDLVANRPVRVGDIESGYLTGMGLVQYAQGQPQRRRMVREPGYRAQFRINDQLETLHFLQGCANDVTYGGVRYFGFTFESERAVVPAPAPPAPPVVPVAPTPIRVVPPAATATGPTTTVVEFQGRRFIVPVGTTVTVEEGIARIAVPEACEIRVEIVRPVTRPKAVRLKTPVATTGTAS
jgi:hypothetical protein